MDLNRLFQNYESVAAKADQAFQRMEKEYGSCINCKLHCSDCCHAVFGLFLIEAAYLSRKFAGLQREKRGEALMRCAEADRGVEELNQELKRFQDEPQMQNLILAKKKIPCPLLDDKDECVLYPARPITCRLYGIPVVIQGKARVCGRSAFDKDQSYPAFDMDEAYRELYYLSGALLETAGQENAEKAGLLVSVSKAIKTPMEELIVEDFEAPEKAP